MNRIRRIACTLALLLAATSTARAQLPAAVGGADPVAAYARPSTNLVVVVDMAQVDLDKLIAYATEKAKANGVPAADIEKGLAEGKEQVDHVRSVLAQFKQTGASKVYALLNVQGIMTGDFGVVVVPTDSPANGQKVADMLNKQLNPEGKADAPMKATVQGSAAVLGSPGAMGEKPAAGLALAKAAAAGAAAPAALRVIFNPAMLADQPGLSPEDKQTLANVEALSLSANVPPRTSLALSVTAKDTATAKQVADKYAGALAQGKNDPQAKQALGTSLDPLLTALAAKVQGNTVTISLDTKQIEEVVVPAVAKMAAAQKADAAK